jgi:metal-dependent hydrolase (beta-lactamase superfamily II)
MAKLKCLSSNSSGNSYILECNGERLLLELGVKWQEILKGLNYKLGDVVGVLVSHSHG